MIAALARFVDALRQEGIVVSPAEMLDAGRAFDLVGPEERWQVRAALKATLAKDRRTAEMFDRVFDRFFVPPATGSQGRRPGEKTTESSDRRGRGAGGTPPPDTKPRPKPEKRQTQQGRAASERLAKLLDHARRDGEGRTGRLRRARLRPGTLETTLETSKPGESADPVRRALAARMTTDEERRIAREVPRMIDALRLRVGRRAERSSSGRPWLRQALRQSVATGGVPFVIPMRTPGRKRARVVVLADVSFSVDRAAGFFLWMAASFLELGRHSRILLFVDRPVDATEAIRRWAARAADETRMSSFRALIDSLRDLNPHAPSDYGTAFHALLASSMRPRGRDTVLVILGDGRTNRFDALPWALEEVSRGCRATLWLVPEPRARWGTADSALPDYLPSVDVVVEATDLEGLALGVGELIRWL